MKITMSLEEAYRDFYVALEDLNAVTDFNSFAEKYLKVLQIHSPPFTSREARKLIKKADEKAKEVKARLTKTNPEFRIIIDERKRQAKRDVDQRTAEYRAGMAKSARMEAERIRDNFATEHRMKVRTLEETEKEISSELICPICQDSDRGNLMNGVPTCFKCWHKLIPKSELKNYNRAYRRAWKKRKK